MTIPRFYQALCVTVLAVSLLAVSVSGVSLWSRLKHRIRMDAYLHKREMADQHNAQIDMFDPDHGVKMGIPNHACDDGVNGISIDWSRNSALICEPGDSGKLKNDANPIDIVEDPLPAQHVCLDKQIIYKSVLPLSGDHRPLWPKFGEYKYLPPSRWVHSLEHGAVVLLYHPCVNESDDFLTLKALLRQCLTKHITAPYRIIPNNMPFALLAYGHAKLLSNAADLDIVKDFIRDYALIGPEKDVLKDGQYNVDLLHGVKSVTNNNNCTGTH